MNKFVRDLIEHLLEVAWAFFLIFLMLFGLAVIFGRCVGYTTTLWVCLGFTAVVAAVFAVIVIGSLLWTGVTAIYSRLSNRFK